MGRFAGHPRLHGHDPAAGTDTHGLPWEGRQLATARYAADDGSADPATLAALRVLAAAAPAARADAELGLVAALAASRVLVPIVAAPADDPSDAADAATTTSTPTSTPTSMTTSTMTTALLRGPDGTLAQPVFTSVAALARWDPAARPVPTPLAEAARAALEEGCVAMPVDLADAHAAVLRASHLWAAALGEQWVPAHTDPVIRLAAAEAAQGIDGLLGARVEDGALHAPGTLRLVLTLRPGLSGPALDAIVRTMGERLAADPDVRRRIDDLAVVLHQATDPADVAPVEL